MGLGGNHTVPRTAEGICNRQGAAAHFGPNLAQAQEVCGEDGRANFSHSSGGSMLLKHVLHRANDDGVFGHDKPPTNGLLQTKRIRFEAP